MVLRKITDRHFVTPPQRAGIAEPGRLRHVGRVSEQRLEERGLPGAVSPDQHDLLATIDDGAEIGEHAESAKCLRQAADFDRDLAGRPFQREFDIWSLDV